MNHENFYIYVKEQLCYREEDNIMYKRVLNLMKAIQSICQKMSNNFNIYNAEKYYHDLLCLKVLNQINKEIKGLNTDELQNYLSSLPNHSIQPFNTDILDAHGYCLMIITKNYYPFCIQEGLNEHDYKYPIKELLSSINEKQMLKEKLKHCLEKDKKQKI